MSIVNLNRTTEGNFWELNPHMIYLEPFRSLYLLDETKSKDKSSKDMWCVFWLEDPDEDINKYYRLSSIEEKLEVCKAFHPEFDEEHPLIIECREKYPHLCLNADELAYKLQKDQLIQISQFLAKQEINMDTVKDLIDLKAKMPKIYQDFEKLDKMFQKSKGEQRVWGRGKLTAREKGHIIPDE